MPYICVNVGWWFRFLLSLEKVVGRGSGEKGSDQNTVTCWEMGQGVPRTLLCMSEQSTCTPHHLQPLLVNEKGWPRPPPPPPHPSDLEIHQLLKSTCVIFTIANCWEHISWIQTMKIPPILCIISSCTLLGAPKESLPQSIHGVTNFQIRLSLHRLGQVRLVIWGLILT